MNSGTIKDGKIYKRLVDRFQEANPVKDAIKNEISALNGYQCSSKVEIDDHLPHVYSADQGKRIIKDKSQAGY
ncbi:Hypothetical predicted protein [Mytilus galloprovincialis]|uniref:Uncharacterized protein n=1 Tax=Mytilus galloprovincialis TaxID=29158 RepID=A0A8B6GSZ3_MYTGA|nr:Hypothetical predicted protein [Mytilus galloprovincialis]